MPQVRDILERKGPHVHTVGKDASALQAALLMNEHHIGSLVVLDGDRVAGMFTERDVLRRVVAERRDPATTRVAEVMTTDVYCCTPRTGLDEARAVIRDRRIRHLPVIADDGALAGLVSIGDLNAYDAANQEQTIFLMSEYLYGRV
jgi:CBS domain-containing protein